MKESENQIVVLKNIYADGEPEESATAKNLGKKCFGFTKMDAAERRI